jgi:hypothetical protein
VLEAVETPSEKPCGACFIRRVSITDPLPLAGNELFPYNPRRKSVTEFSECGRFAVVDDSGVALVDDDCFEIWSLDTEHPRLFEDEILGAFDGAVVEVFGPATWINNHQLGLLAPTNSYRSSPRILAFNGRPEAVVTVLVRAGGTFGEQRSETVSAG